LTCPNVRTGLGRIRSSGEIPSETLRRFEKTIHRPYPKVPDLMNATSLSIETLSGSATPSAENEDWVVYSTRRQDVVLREQGGRAVAPSTHRKALPRPDFSRRVLRRLKGFLVEDQGSECKVA